MKGVIFMACGQIVHPSGWCKCRYCYGQTQQFSLAQGSPSGKPWVLMANWEYKVISSGKGGFASPALMEKFINDLGQENWEIISFHQPSDNALAFSGLARRTTQRDWTLEDAAKAAARVEADKLRAEFEAKFKAATGTPQPAATEDQGETFLAEEKAGAEGSIRRLRDTSRDDDPDAPEDESGAGPKDDWDKLASEDELPTFFDAMRPHMRRNQRGPGMSVGVDFLAKKWRLEESDIKTALVECGMQIPADENAKPVYVEYEGELYWVNINRRGEIWINLREKPEPVFRIVPGKRLTDEEAPVAETAAPAAAPREHFMPKPQPVHHEAQQPREPRPAAPVQQQAALSAAREQQPRTLLDKIRGMMRRNRRGNGMSGSFPFLIKALKTTEAGLLEQLAVLGLKLQDEKDPKPAFHEEGDFLYWMNKNQRGEIWINARKERRQTAGGPPMENEGSDNHDEFPTGSRATAADVSSSEGTIESPSATPAVDAAPAADGSPVAVALAASASVEPSAHTAHTLAAVRLLLQPKKRGEGVAALVVDIAQQLGQTSERLVEALAAAGVKEPVDADAKPTFGENAGEIFWLNRNPKGELWLNAKASKAAAKKSSSKATEGKRPKKKDDEASGD